MNPCAVKTCLEDDVEMQKKQQQKDNVLCPLFNKDVKEKKKLKKLATELKQNACKALFREETYGHLSSSELPLKGTPEYCAKDYRARLRHSISKIVVSNSPLIDDDFIYFTSLADAFRNIAYNLRANDTSANLSCSEAYSVSQTGIRANPVQHHEFFIPANDKTSDPDEERLAAGRTLFLQ